MAENGKKRIFYYVDDYVACAWYRCHVPGIELLKKGHEIMLDHTITPQQVDWADVVVFQRQTSPDAMAAIGYANSSFKRTIYELDDDVWNIHPSNPAYQTWSKPGMLQAAEECIRSCQAVTTTTPALAEQLSKMNKDVNVIPNMLPGEFWRYERPKPQRDDAVTIGWAGSITHFADLKILEGAMEQVLDEYPHVEFLYAGAAEIPFKPHARMRARLDSVKLEQYPWLLWNFDIGLAPVLDTKFNRCKSDLKYLEYAAVGLPVIASKVEPYANSVVHGENGYLARNPKDWLKYLKRLIGDRELRERLGANAKRFAESRMVERNVALWERAYKIA